MQTTVDAVAPVQVKEIVYQKLRDALIDHEFAPGESLREVALSTRFGVSKTPIREALVRLDHDGLVEVIPYRGARARIYTVADARELFEAREMIEAECVRLAVKNPGGVLEILAKNVAQTRTALEAGDLGRAASRLDSFDEILFGLLHNKLLEEVVEKLTLHLRRLGKMGAGRRRFEDSAAQHEAIVAALRQGDAFGAQAVLREHLASVLEAQVAVLETAENRT